MRIGDGAAESAPLRQWTDTAAARPPTPCGKEKEKLKTEEDIVE